MFKNNQNKYSDPVLIALCDLDPFPLQTDSYAPCTVGEDDALERELRRDGQRDPLILLPANPARGRDKDELLDGHRRRAMLLKMGQTHAQAVYRHDLTDADDAAIETAFFNYNFARRQLSVLEKGRIGLRLMEREKNKQPGGIRLSADEGEARERVGKLLGMSGRHLHRIFRVLLTPPEVVKAVQDGRLPLVLAEKVEGLDPSRQAEVAKRLSELSDPAMAKRMVQEFTGAFGHRHMTAENTFNLFISRLEAGARDLEQRLDHFDSSFLAAAQPQLQRAQGLLTRLLEQATRAD